MKKIWDKLKIAIALGLCVACVACGPQKKDEHKANDNKNQSEINFTDAAGRQVKLKKLPDKIIADSPTSLRLYSYINGMDKIIAVPPREKRGASRRPYALAYKEQIDKIPEISGESNVDNYEQVLLSGAEAFIMTSGKDVAEYDKIQEKIGAPVVVVDPGTGVVFDEKLYKSLEIIGKVTGKEQRAKEVVEYMDGIKKDLNKRTESIPEAQRKNAYAGGLAWSGAHGIENTRENYPLFTAVNVKNVVTGINKNGSVEIDKEQILKWNPEYIFVDLASAHLIQEDYNKNKDFYKSLDAFKNGKVYCQIPFVWCHVNIDSAMANSYYVGKQVYPEQFKDVDVVAKTNEIYKFLVGKEVYNEIASYDYGGYQPMTISELDGNKYVKSK